MPLHLEKVDSPELIFQRYPSRKGVVFGTKGVVASSQPLATSAGLEILNKGGNAADAAVAVSAALNVTEPCSCGIGGDAFCLFYSAKDKTVKALNGSGRSPANLTIDYLRKERNITGESIPASDLNSVTVPGCADAWIETVKNFGSGNLTLQDVLSPAIRLAENGFPVTEITSYSWQQSEALLKLASPNGHEMLLNGKAPLPGQLMKLPNLAETFRTLAASGRDAFYKGRVAQAIVDLIQSQGGVMTMHDLESHKTTLVEPISIEYSSDIRIYECPPNGQGLTALLALGILEALQVDGRIRPLNEMDHNSPEYLHILIESLRVAFADTLYYVTDPEVETIPLTELLSKEYLKKRSKLIDINKTNPKVVHGSPVQSSDTVYFTATDQWGNACSMIQSNYAGFGTGAIPKGCGFTLQNRGTGFSLTPGHPNALKGGKRPYHTIIPSIVTKDDNLFMTFGVMAGFMQDAGQPQGHVQVLLNMLRGFTPQAALDAPRFCISAGTPDSKETQDINPINSEVYVEEGIPVETVEKLIAMGHDARVAGGFNRATFGRGQVIQKLQNEDSLVWAAGSDPRADGHAAAQI